MDTLVQDYYGITGNDGSNQYKLIAYDYDLISGKVNGVDYQPGKSDAFYHRYRYDAENRIVSVYTSRDSLVWERDAAYKYYKHGPLSRTVLGGLQVQGLDYSYTLQGWLKGVNLGTSGSVSETADNSGASCSAGTAVDDAVVDTRATSGGPVTYTARSSIDFVSGFEVVDGDAFQTVIDTSLGICTTGAGSGTDVTTATETYPISRDAYSYSLHYFPGDYQPVGSTTSPAGILQSMPSGEAAPLYNGNIAAMAVNVSALKKALVYNYHYDQLNRIRKMDAYGGWDTVSQTFNPIKLDDYQERVGYDPNGNILGYLRNGSGASTGGSALAMDSLNYGYYAGTNRLKHISDGVAAANYSTDIDNQATDANYTYDSIGNLKTDVASGITDIACTVYGKIDSITNSSGTIHYTYDAAGNRITKTAGGVTWIYVRDARGNVMSAYKDSAGYKQTEIDLYGSSRLGILGALTTAPTSVTLPGGGLALLSTFTRGEKSYELANHLGNVLATITDKKIGVSSAADSSLIDHYVADVATAQDYYPFGMLMPGRSFNAATAGNYRYGFNGKENDDEVKGKADQIDYGMRVYDPRVGKFLSVDPLTKKYPWYTPYQFAGNIPIAMIDLDGLEEVSASIGYNPNTGTGSARYPVLKPSEWKEVDRQSISGSFVSAARYNTNNLNSAVYKPVAQIHAYYVWAADEVGKINSNIKFFDAARDVTGFLGVGGAYMFPEMVGLSEHGRKSLGDVNARLLKENIPVVRDILNNGKSDAVKGNGVVWDFNYVHREQTFLTDVITKDPLSRSDETALNATFSRFEFVHPEYSLAKVLVGAASIDYKNQDHREAIGRSLVFIQHFLKDNDYEKTSNSAEFKSAIDYLNKAYGEKNTQNFLNKYRDTFGQ